jgi:hypothetical protein
MNGHVGPSLPAPLGDLVLVPTVADNQQTPVRVNVRFAAVCEAK